MQRAKHKLITEVGKEGEEEEEGEEEAEEAEEVLPGNPS